MVRIGKGLFTTDEESIQAPLKTRVSCDQMPLRFEKAAEINPSAAESCTGPDNFWHDHESEFPQETP
jgi:hypothetical protein